MTTSVLSGGAVHHGLPAHEVVLLLETDAHRGLGEREAGERLARYGPNTLPPAKGAGLLVRILRQFHHPLIYVLMAAGVITAVLAEYVDSAVTFGVVLINAVVGPGVEAEAALESLRSMAHTRATVIRGGHRRAVAAEGPGPEDLVLLEAGDKVPADMRLTRLAELRINESALTGGSVPVTKDEVVLPQGLPVADRRNMAYSGTLVTTGSGAGIVIGRAAETELFEDLGTVRGDGRFLDVVLLRDLLGAVSELACGPLGIGLLVEERGDGLAERVRCDPLESSIGASLPPLASHVVRGEPRANPGGEDRVERVVSSGEFAVHHHRDGESGQDDRSEAGVAFRPFLSEEALAL